MHGSVREFGIFCAVEAYRVLLTQDDAMHPGTDR
jgi:hypothetical protein